MPSLFGQPLYTISIHLASDSTNISFFSASRVARILRCTKLRLKLQIWEQVIPNSSYEQIKLQYTRQNTRQECHAYFPSHFQIKLKFWPNWGCFLKFVQTTFHAYISGLKYRFCKNCINISPVTFELALEPHNDINLHANLNFNHFFGLRGF